MFPIPLSHQEIRLYLPNIQNSYQAVDWQNLDVLFIPVTLYKFVNIGNLPQSSLSHSLGITGCGGKVRVGARGITIPTRQVDTESLLTMSPWTKVEVV